MKLAKETQDTLEFKGYESIFYITVSFLIFLIFIGISFLSITIKKEEFINNWHWYKYVLLLSFLILMGSFVFSPRSSLTINRFNGEIRYLRKIFFSAKEKIFYFKDIKGVMLEKTKQKISSGSTIKQKLFTWKVSVLINDDSKIPIDEFEDKAIMRNLAEKICDFSGCPLIESA